jgi:hypothetical protein
MQRASEMGKRKMEKAFTYCSEEGIAELKDSLPERYEMSLVSGEDSDMDRLVDALLYTWQSCPEEELSEWAGAFLSSIATTLEIEFV